MLMLIPYDGGQGSDVPCSSGCCDPSIWNFPFLHFTGIFPVFSIWRIASWEQEPARSAKSCSVAIQSSLSDTECVSWTQVGLRSWSNRFLAPLGYHRGWNESQISAVHLCDVAEQHLEETVSEQSSSVQTRLAEELSKKEKTIKDFLGSRGVDIPGSDAVQLLHPESPDLDLPSTPCIFIMGEQLFKVAVDQMIVNDHIKSPIAALSYAFSMFYVLNIKYPKDMSLTLEFIQRVFLGLNPKRGSKAEMKGKKHHHIPPRLLKFVNELYDFDSPWKI
ncbi:uncharacterized protein LOC116725887 [Xiphophorus hellerii]|uniref:uncharacterized protein LOC116725887 n=1 Tax=Xiphophorus hellerii TaxID=8084 RepID=UPI0013B3D38C|nr:uncharacterized protein LOC116725887 [Xiphophorus hellerii]